MALETLKGVTEIGGFKVVRDKPIEMSWDDFDKMRDEYPINITDRMNCISFKIQDGPIKEHGVNGCQVDTLIYAAKAIIEGLNKQFPSVYNKDALFGLHNALVALRARTKDREARGVEGESKA